MKRFSDLLVSCALLILLSPVFLTICVLVKLSSRGPAFHVSRRVGINNGELKMIKFRTMRLDAPDVATHLMTEPGKYLTGIGRFLRRTSLDELPQLINVIKGDMSIVGPRPALHNQDDLVALRTEKGVHELVPGITGWAQTHGRDEIPIPDKVELDAYYLEHRGFWIDLKILGITVINAFKGKDVSH